jgi:hypothetical protein
MKTEEKNKRVLFKKDYRKAVTERKSEVVAMTQIETRPNTNWVSLRERLPRVPGIP